MVEGRKEEKENGHLRRGRVFLDGGGERTHTNNRREITSASAYYPHDGDRQTDRDLVVLFCGRQSSVVGRRSRRIIREETGRGTDKRKGPSLLLLRVFMSHDPRRSKETKIRPPPPLWTPPISINESKSII